MTCPHSPELSHRWFITNAKFHQRGTRKQARKKLRISFLFCKILLSKHKNILNILKQNAVAIFFTANVEGFCCWFCFFFILAINTVGKTIHK